MLIIVCYNVRIKNLNVDEVTWVNRIEISNDMLQQKTYGKRKSMREYYFNVAAFNVGREDVVGEEHRWRCFLENRLLRGRGRKGWCVCWMGANEFRVNRKNTNEDVPSETRTFKGWWVPRSLPSTVNMSKAEWKIVRKVCWHVHFQGNLGIGLALRSIHMRQNMSVAKMRPMRPLYDTDLVYVIGQNKK